MNILPEDTVNSEIVMVNLRSGYENKISPMITLRDDVSVVASGGCILVFGGRLKYTNIVVRYCEMYNPMSDRRVNGTVLYLTIKL